MHECCKINTKIEEVDFLAHLVIIKYQIKSLNTRVIRNWICNYLLVAERAAWLGSQVFVTKVKTFKLDISPTALWGEETQIK